MSKKKRIELVGQCMYHMINLVNSLEERIATLEKFMKAIDERKARRVEPSECRVGDPPRTIPTTEDLRKDNPIIDKILKERCAGNKQTS